jgi:hypothetical protein
VGAGLARDSDRPSNALARGRIIAVFLEGTLSRGQ